MNIDTIVCNAIGPVGQFLIMFTAIAVSVLWRGGAFRKPKDE